MSRADASGAQPGGLHLLQGTAPGQTPALEAHSDSSHLRLQCHPSGPINQPLRPNPPRHRLAKVVIPLQPQANRVLYK